MGTECLKQVNFAEGSAHPDWISVDQAKEADDDTFFLRKVDLSASMTETVAFIDDIRNKLDYKLGFKQLPVLPENEPQTESTVTEVVQSLASEVMAPGPEPEAGEVAEKGTSGENETESPKDEAKDTPTSENEAKQAERDSVIESSRAVLQLKASHLQKHAQWIAEEGRDYTRIIG
jgi:hypothetical protein